jgi:hypothetical protein
MDILEKDIKAEYLAASQLVDLIKDIEGCAQRLADVAKKAVVRAELQTDFLKTLDKNK